MIAARGLRYGEDRVLVQAKIVAPAADVFPRWPPLPPARQVGLGLVAQRPEKLFEEIFGNLRARPRALLLLYSFL